MKKKCKHHAAEEVFKVIDVDMWVLNVQVSDLLAVLINRVKACKNNYVKHCYAYNCDILLNACEVRDITEGKCSTEEKYYDNPEVVASKYLRVCESWRKNFAYCNPFRNSYPQKEQSDNESHYMLCSRVK